MKDDLPQTGKSVELKISGDENACAEINSELFEWVIENLIKNALDAIEGVSGKIEISVKEFKKRVEVEVTDTGKGVEIKRRKGDVAKRALVLGINVVLEFGFWSREERMYFRVEAEALGVSVELHYLAMEVNQLWERLSRRNSNLPPGTFVVSRDNLELWVKSFEPPMEDEGIAQ